MIAYAVAVLLWISIIIYAALEGADFGGGVLDLFAVGAKGDEQRSLIKEAIGPVWEANNVWLTYLVVGLLTGFPIVIELLATALFIPFVLILFGIVLRGASFVFRSFSGRGSVIGIWSRVFSLSSFIVPFLFGACGAAIAAGKLHLINGQMPVGLISAWLTPFAIVMGLLGITLCTVIAAVYLTVEAQGSGKPELAEMFRRRALIAGAITTVLGVVGLYLASQEAPILWHGMLDHALWAVGCSALLGIATAIVLFIRHYRLARVLVILTTGAVIGTWGLAQIPYIVPPDFTVANSASPPFTMIALFVCAIIGMSMLIPALWLLFHVFKGANVVPPVHNREVEGF
jgi:cytochrome d ubiquinol oxidase subunit II